MPRTFLSIQYLRGVAAVLVVYFHTKVYLADYAWGLPRKFGYSGVDLFFCISGFIMMHTTLGRPMRPVAFLRRRFERVYPLYWLLTLTSLGLYVVLPSAFIDGSATLSHAVLSLLLIAHDDAPVLKIGWTLVYEVYFYALFAIMLLIPRKGPRMLALLATITGLVALGALLTPQSPVLQTYTHPFLLEFLAGAVLGYALRSERFPALPGVVLFGCVLVGMLLMGLGAERQSGDGFSRVAWFGSGATLIVFAGLCRERQGQLFEAPWLRELGDASYSLYLAHPFVLTAFRQVGRRLGLAAASPLAEGAVVIAAILVSIGAGWLLYRFVETPLRAFVRGRRTGRPSATDIDPGAPIPAPLGS
ncbi:acyltransferase [Aureimonas sp. AU20]|uniref:acyltransferase family protein n=1 Tax=Aureimonas sp. AU20 TaxID=1349819 RepID=UPI000722B36C|nr:acyltransferase [Aureimonas sp. AU20]ALN71543.1 hypothetical protein M673_02390 [Aureimonas sp. AU20]